MKKSILQGEKVYSLFRSFDIPLDRATVLAHHSHCHSASRKSTSISPLNYTITYKQIDTLLVCHIDSELIHSLADPRTPVLGYYIASHNSHPISASLRAFLLRRADRFAYICRCRNTGQNCPVPSNKRHTLTESNLRASSSDRTDE